MPKREVSEAMKDLRVEREPFEAIVRKLLNAPPTTKREISRKINQFGRKRRLTKPVAER